MDDVKVALDTNILAYSEGVNDAAMQALADRLLDALDGRTTYVPLQVLGELFNVLVRKAGRHPAHARASVEEFGEIFQTIETTEEIFRSALDLAVRHQLQIWDAIVLAAAASEGCTMLLSEDFQHGFASGGVTVVNPFTEPRHRLLASIIDAP